MKHPNQELKHLMWCADGMLAFSVLTLFGLFTDYPVVFIVCGLVALAILASFSITLVFPIPGRFIIKYPLVLFALLLLYSKLFAIGWSVFG